MATRWSVPPMWVGQTVAIFATGPSLTQAVCDEWNWLERPAIAINDAYRLAPWADMLYAADASWWERNPKALKFAGLKVTCNNGCQRPEVLLLKQAGVEGFAKSPDSVMTGGNSGYQAIHVAIHAKAARVMLYGYDMHGEHFFGRHKTPLRNTEPDSYARWVERFPALIGRGTEIINCTPGSRLKCFPFEVA